MGIQLRYCGQAGGGGAGGSMQLACVHYFSTRTTGPKRVDWSWLKVSAILHAMGAPALHITSGASFLTVEGNVFANSHGAPAILVDSAGKLGGCPCVYPYCIAPQTLSTPRIQPPTFACCVPHIKTVPLKLKLPPKRTLTYFQPNIRLSFNLLQGHDLENNLALGTVAEGSPLPVTPIALFDIRQQPAKAIGNVAAGGARVCFAMPGESCAVNVKLATIANNAARGCLAGLLLRAANGGVACTQLVNFTAHHNWDYGVLSAPPGLPTNLLLHNLLVSDTQHAALLPLLCPPGDRVVLQGGALMGLSDEACGACTPAGLAAGVACPPQLAQWSERRLDDGGNELQGASYGLLAATFAAGFSEGPDRFPWDGVRGVPANGSMLVDGTAFVGFPGEFWVL